jgi:hypothetical protein
MVRHYIKSKSDYKLGESSLDGYSAQVFPYNIFTYCSTCRVDCKFARNKLKQKRLQASTGGKHINAEK